MIDKPRRQPVADSNNGEAKQKGKPTRRFLLVIAVLVAFGTLIVFQLFRWQVFEHEGLVSLARVHAASLSKEPVAIRGRILDRNQHLLALDIFEYSLWASPDQATDRKNSGRLDELARLIGKTRGQVDELIGSNRPYVQLAHNVDEQTRQNVDNLDLVGMDWEAQPKRIYPEGPLAAHVLGFVNASHMGYYGVEGFYNRQLVGDSRSTPSQIQDDPILALCNVREMKPGRELILSIDRAIQYIAENELSAAVKKYQATGGTILIMEPNSGAILAMANYPGFDPNHFPNTAAERFMNPAVSEQYEPGSVFKVLTLAAGIDAGVVTPNTTYNDTGELEVGGRPIFNWDRASHGVVNMTGVLAQSLNVGAAYVSTTMGRDRFYTYVRRFGFGKLTDVDLADEMAGTLKLPGGTDWHESDLGTNAFGQGIAVTPLQMLRATAVVASRGLLMKPYVVAQIIDDGQVIDVKPTVVRRAISAETASQMTEMMIDAVERETALASVAGYAIAGKTGTAEIPTPGGYKTDDTIASFIGFAPARSPRFIVLVKIDRPKKSVWGSQVAAPVFRNVASQLFTYLGIAPDNVAVAERFARDRERLGYNNESRDGEQRQ